MTNESYRIMLDRIAAECPIVGDALARADRVRTERLEFFWHNTARLHGLEEFTAFLATVTKWFHGFPDLKPITFLLVRAGADFATAIEATISGFHAVAWESMRDVMEIELLLGEFAADPKRMQLWVSSDEKKRRQVFSHGEMRKRKAARLGVAPSETIDSVDYRGHSIVLHVNPVSNPFGHRGLSREAIDVGADACFWDIYQHGKNLLSVIRKLFDRFGEGCDIDNWKPPNLNRFASEYKEAMEIQGLMMEKLKHLETVDANSAEDNGA